jgi:hypothetical protein|tara:strand:- start:738 stop:983 length:246 start_codon:yes stop_codon:yes gene_type:complete
MNVSTGTERLLTFDSSHRRVARVVVVVRERSPGGTPRVTTIPASASASAGSIDEEEGREIPPNRHGFASCSIASRARASSW